MAAIPHEKTTAQHILDAYQRGHSCVRSGPEAPHRPHLGASVIGDECERKLYYLFHWADHEEHEGRLMRLFDTGHMAEHRFVADLRAIGVEVHEVDPSTGKQFRIEDVGGHFGGSLDGAGVGVPEAPKTWHVLEFKTHSEKSFKKLQEKGVKVAKPLHYAQMMVYMGKTKMTRALYLACNKNNDDLYSERIEFDKVLYEQLLARAERVIKAQRPPAGISDNPGWFECKFCAYHSLCHGGQVPEVNCRTCASATPCTTTGGGTWHCNKPTESGGKPYVIPIEVQRKGCVKHRYDPPFLEGFATPVDYHNGDVVYEVEGGKKFSNGEGQGAYSSAEIRRIGIKAALAEFAAFKELFPGAKVVA